MSIKTAHLSGQIRDPQRISQSEDRILECSKHLRGLASAQLAGILT